MRTIAYVLLIAVVVVGGIYFTPLRTIQIPGLGILNAFGHLIDQTKDFFGNAKKSALEAPQAVQEGIVHTSGISLNALSDSASALHGELQNKAADLLNLEHPSSATSIITSTSTHGFEVCATLKKNESAAYEVRNPSTPKQKFSVSVEWGDGKVNTLHAKETDEKITLAHQYSASGTYENTFTVTNASGTAIFQRNLCVE